MKLDIVAKNKNDEYYTPRYAIEPILKYLPNNAIVWCPFDTKESLFVEMLKTKGCKVIHSHIDDGQDFFEYEPEEPYQCIVSNPPYSKKNEVLQRLKELDKPFAMLMGAVGIFESQVRFNLMKDINVDILIMNKRVDFFESFSEQKPSKNPPFSSWYITSRILPRQIIYEEINKKAL